MSAAARGSSGDAEGLAAVRHFLPCETPSAWFEQAPAHLDVLLIDHANCEKKAASTALGLLHRHVDRPALLERLSPLAREELIHFERVHRLLRRRGIPYRRLSAGRYAATLMSHVRSGELPRLVDTLLVGAIVEARSCERFAGLADRVDAELGAFYAGLLAAEARHFQDYLKLASCYAEEPLAPRLEALLDVEAQLVSAPDDRFRFHSGPLATSA